jgi:hypothetical protein
VIDAGKTMALALLSICVNIVLMAVKIAAGIAGNSYALVADGIESAGDIFTSLVTCDHRMRTIHSAMAKSSRLPVFLRGSLFSERRDLLRGMHFWKSVHLSTAPSGSPCQSFLRWWR